MEKIKFLVIHNRDPGRKEVLVKELINNGVLIEDIEFIEYPNKDELTFKIKKLSVQKKSMRHNYSFPNITGTIKDGWICVSYKHFLALEKIVENNYKYAVIIEDNVGKIKKNIIETLHECLKQLPKNWDVVFDSTRAHSFEFIKEGKVSNEKIVYEKKLGYSYNENGKIVAGGGTKSAQFFLLNQSSAKKLYENYLPFNHAPDVWMNELFRYLNFKCFWIEPSITENRKNHSSSTNFESKNLIYQIKSKIINRILFI